MSKVWKYKCNQCGAESDTGASYLEILDVVVVTVEPDHKIGRRVIENDSELHVCGQECYHKWHAAQLAKFYEPKP